MKRCTLVMLGLLSGIFVPSVAIAQNGTQPTAPAPVTAPTQALTPGQVTAIGQQQQQLVTQLGMQLNTATPSQQQAIINNFHQQMVSLTANLLPTQPTPAQQTAQAEAAVQASVQTLSPEAQQVYNLSQQRLQLAQQIGASTQEQQAVLIVQLRQLNTQMEQAIQAQLAAQPAGIPAPTTSSLNMTAGIASLPSDQQLAILAAAQYRQAIFAALQLPISQQAAALRAINAPGAAASATIPSTSGTGTPSTPIPNISSP